VLAKRGRGRPKDAKNKEQRTANDRFWRLYLTVRGRQRRQGLTVSPATRKARRRRLNQYARQALREFYAHLFWDTDYSQEECERQRRLAQDAYRLMCQEANCRTEGEVGKLDRSWKNRPELYAMRSLLFKNTAAAIF
jgi:hypothetical protein